MLARTLFWKSFDKSSHSSGDLNTLRVALYMSSRCVTLLRVLSSRNWALQQTFISYDFAELTETMTYYLLSTEMVIGRDYMMDDSLELSGCCWTHFRRYSCSESQLKMVYSLPERILDDPTSNELRWDQIHNRGSR